MNDIRMTSGAAFQTRKSSVLGLVSLSFAALMLFALSACGAALRSQPPQRSHDKRSHQGVKAVDVCATQNDSVVQLELDTFDPLDPLDTPALNVPEDPPLRPLLAPTRSRAHRPKKPVAGPAPIALQGADDASSVDIAPRDSDNEAQAAQVDSVYFRENESSIPEPTPSLDAIVAVLEANPGGLVILEGHAAATELAGSALSLRRAEVARSYLIRRGVPRDRVRVRSHGSNRPSSISAREAGAQNRRVALLLRTQTPPI